MPLSRDDLDGLDSFRYGLPGALDEDDYEIEMDGISQSSSQSAFDRLNRNVHFAIQSALKGSSSASARVSGSSGTMRPLYQRSQPLREAVSQISTDQAQRETQNEQPRKPSAVLLYQIDSSNSGSDVWPDVRDIKKIPAKYVPLAPDPYPSLTGRRDRATPRNFDIGRPKKIRALSALSSGPPPTCPVISGIGWLSNRIPAELYADIISYLSRDEIKAMRLTCKEFERHVSHAMFSTVVVPFNTEIYGMLEADSPNTLPIKVDVKGKGKARASDFGTVWKNKNRDDLYTGHGIDVYRGFGPHIQRYGMTFEVDEEALARPPHKTTTEMHSSYWGNFDWPFQEYRRFDHVADLELAADETPKMKQAFSYLKKVKELALSVDSGLGWLNGPDASARTRVLRGPAPVFGASHPIADRQTRAKQQLWETLKGLHTAYRGSCDLRQATLRQVDVEFSYSDFEDLLERHLACGSLSSDICYAQSNLVRDLQSSTGVRRVSDAFDVPVVSPKGGVDEVMAMDPFDMNTVLDVSDSRVRPGQRGAIFMVEDSVEPQLLKRHPLVPNTLTKPQKEWLLETEWAQRAFLASYMVAILDNPATFENVHTLNLSRVSSRYVSSLCRVDFWEALPSLHTVVVKVIPDWRTVEKDPAGFVETPMTTPSDAVRPFYRLLQRMLAPMDNVKTLEIGWASGGEHAEGLHARNHHLLPAPFIPPAFLNNGPNRPAIEEQLIIFPHVEHFILSNCWITPFTFTAFAKKHESASLEKLTLDSVSLSPVERANNAANANNQGLAQLFQNLQNIGQQVIVAPGPVAPPVQQPGQIVFPQNLLQHLQNLPANMPPPNFQQFFANNQNPQVQGIFNAWMNAQQAAGANPLVQPPDWRGPHRDGSWPFVLDIISPGKNFSDFNNTTSNADNDRIAKSALAEIELVSCGYARVTSPYFDNSTVDNPTPNPMTPYFQKRHEALANCVLKASDSYHGDIVQYMPQNEILAMQTVWDCRHGWEDASKAEEPTFDGALLGGTGRMSGLIRRSDRDQLEMP